MSNSCVPRSTTHQGALQCSGVLSRGDGSTIRLSLDVPTQELWARRASYTTPNNLETLSSSYSREPQGSVSQGETAFLHFIRVPSAKDPPHSSFPEDSTTTMEVSLLTVQSPCQEVRSLFTPPPRCQAHSPASRWGSLTLRPHPYHPVSRVFSPLHHLGSKTHPNSKKGRVLEPQFSVPSLYTSKEKDALSQPLEYK